MEFLNKKDQKYYSKMLKRSMQRAGPYKIKNLVLNYSETNIKVAKMKNEKMLLDYCGLANEYSQNICFIILAKKITQTFLYKKEHVVVYCSINWRVNKIKKVLPNEIIPYEVGTEYAFIMSPNLFEYLKIEINDKLRI